MGFVPARIVPPARPLGRLALLAGFVRNPLRVLPQAAYEEDAVVVGGGPTPVVLLTAPALVKTVLLDERDKFQKLVQIRLLGPLLGSGILTSEGAHWKWQRQACAPMFRSQEPFIPAFVRAAEALVAQWRALPPGSVQPIERCMTRATFDVISATLLPSADKGVAPAIGAATGRFQRSGAWGQLYAILNLPRWLPQPGRASMAYAVYALRASVAALIRERRALGAAAARDDLLDRLMQARDPDSGQAMNDQQLADNLLTFYLAGHETTAKALTWTLYLLSRSKHWSALLEDEIARVTGGGPLAAEHVPRLALVHQVLKEAMRLYPPVPLMSRTAVVNTRLGGLDIRVGSSLVLPIYAIHRHRKRWDEPDAFEPERFAPEREASIPRYQYMPFGAGPRICIGMSFAISEASAMLATLLQHARFEPADQREPVPVARITLLPGDGLPLKVWLR